MKGKAGKPEKGEKGGKVSRLDAAREKSVALLAKIEAELGHVDRTDDAIGEGAEAAEQKLMAETQKPHEVGADPDADAVRIHRLGQLRQARLAAAGAREARRRRDG